MFVHPVLLMLYEPDKLDMTHAHYPTRELATLAPVSFYPGTDAAARDRKASATQRHA